MGKKEKEEEQTEELQEEQPVEEEQQAEEQATEETTEEEPAEEPQEEAPAEEADEEAPAEEPSSEEGRKDSYGRTLYKAKCADCGKETEVPFKPDPNRPVYCRDCFRSHRPSRPKRF